MRQAPSLLILALTAAACASPPHEAAIPTLAQDSVTAPDETAACLARGAAVGPAETLTTQGVSVLEVGQTGGEGRIEVAPDAAGSRVTYEGPGAPPKHVELMIRRCTIAP
jgi:hypothetical protein